MLDEAQRPNPLSVWQSDNDPRVRDGYLNLGACGYARALSAHVKGRACRKNMITSDRACTPIQPLNLHGKEGVDGSSPSEGFDEMPANRHF
jgi:hypothetical protein